MLKKSVCFIATMFLVFLFIGCSVSNNISNTNLATSSSGEINNNHIDAYPTKVYQNLCNSGGLFMNYYASYKQGCYYLETQNDASSLIHYIDYDSAQDVLVTTDLSGSLGDENTAVVPDLIGGAVPLTDGEYLYIVKFSSQYSDVKQAQQSLIHRMELNGLNRETITLPSAKGILPNSTALSYDNEIYVLTYDLLSKEIKTVITKFNFNNNSAEDLFAFETLGSYFIIAGIDDVLYLKFIEANTKQVEPKILELNLTTKTLTEPVWSVGKGSSYAVQGENIYFFDLKNYILSGVNLRTQKIIDDVNLKALDKFNDVEIYSMQNIVFDNKLLFETIVGENFVRPIYYDIYNGNVIETELTADDGNWLTILTENADNFMVYLGRNIVTKKRLSPDGTDMYIDVEEPKVAIMNKSDYWSNSNKMKIVVN